MTQTDVDWTHRLDEHIDALSDELIAIRRHLHSRPEPSGNEYETTRFLADKLKEHGVAFEIVNQGRGLLAGPGMHASSGAVAMRADMDALHIHDEKEAAYRSLNDGVMHACGHDAHSTMVLGAAIALQQCADAVPWPLPWRAIFQPAEETATGAQEMTKVGAVDGVDAVVALHVDPQLPLGAVATKTGALTAYCEWMQVDILGRGGHAARPHHTVDPVAVASQFVNAIYHFIPRAIDSREPVVVSFGVINGGDNANVIPEKVRLEGTIRTISRVATARVKERIREIAHGLTEASKAEIHVEYGQGPDAVINDEGVTAVCLQAAAEVAGRDNVEILTLPSMGGEDFSAYLTRTRGCMLRLGASNGDLANHLHSPKFDIDERALAIGVKLLVHSLVRLATPI